MKKLLTILFALSATAAFAQVKINKNEVPEPVLKAYINQNYNGDKDTTWEKEVIHIYKVKYVENNRVYESQYSADGQWIKTHTIITQDEIPMLAMNHIRTTYPEYSIKQASIVLNNNGKLYVVELQKGKSILVEQFLMNGKVFR
jgi:uncharacterized protein YkuJ